MIFPALIAILSLILYQALTFNVAKARGKYKIMAPAVTGHVEFEKRLRVQLNTLEQLMVFLPSLWLFGLVWMGPMIGSFPGQDVAAVIGAVWILARILYAKDYYADPEKRYLGMILTLLCSAVLSLGALAGIIKKILITYPIHF
jgi:uncharacterized membrane protein YecN with MAPEG domain